MRGRQRGREGKGEGEREGEEERERKGKRERRDGGERFVSVHFRVATRTSKNALGLIIGLIIYLAQHISKMAFL